MDTSKIKKFYATRNEYFKKKCEIAMAMDELELLLRDANQELSDSVDNGFTTDSLVEVAEAYAKHKFNSKAVKDFIGKVDALCLSNVDCKLKEHLEVVDITIHWSNDFANSVNTSSMLKSINGPITMSFADTSTGRCFSLTIPIKTAVHTDLISWNNTCAGMYIVTATIPKWEHKQKDICRVFDQEKIGKAVNAFLSGSLDEEIKVDEFIIDDLHHIIGNTQCDYAFSGSYEDDASRFLVSRFVEVHDLFDTHGIWHTSYPYASNSTVVKSCIDDRADYEVGSGQDVQ